jgi:hypothetical protein
MTPEQLQRQILQWKRKYPELYQLTIADEEEEFCYMFIFRAIGREEYKQLLEENLELCDFQERICKEAVLYPEGYDFSQGLAGIAEVLSNAIIDVSGLHSQQAQQLLEKYRQEMNILDYQADCIIHEAFPEFSLEEIQSWSVRKLMYYLSRAEWILMNLRGVPIVPATETQPSPSSYQYTFTKESTNTHPSPSSSASTPKDPNQLTEQEVLAMLAENEAKYGRKINWQGNSMDDMFPELAWFKHDEELRGEFD